MRRPAWRLLIVAGTVMASVDGEVQPDATRSFLRAELGFSDSDLRELAQGEAPVRSLDTADAREIAIAGAVRVAISPQQYVDELRDIVEFKRHEAVIQIGIFSTPPRGADVAGLTLDRDHLDDLRDCHPGDCDLQLSNAAIGRVQREVRWSTPDAAAEANRLMRDLLVDLVAGYMQRGDAALMTYENERPPLVVADEFRAMIDAPPAIMRRFPDLEGHVREYPRSRMTNGEDLIYWSKEDVGPKVIISVTHMVIARIANGGPVVYAAASKQLYGSHYFDSSLGLTLLLADADPSSTILVYVNRSRLDALDGFLGGLKRAIVRSRARAAMEETLSRIRTRLPARVRAPR